VEGSSHAKNQLDSFSRFSRFPTCDRQTDRHRPMASTADAKHRTVKKQVCSEVWVNSPRGIRGVSPEEEKEGYGGKGLQKEK